MSLTQTHAAGCVWRTVHFNSKVQTTNENETCVSVKMRLDQLLTHADEHHVNSVPSLWFTLFFRGTEKAESCVTTPRGVSAASEEAVITQCRLAICLICWKLINIELCKIICATRCNYKSFLPSIHQGGLFRSWVCRIRKTTFPFDFFCFGLFPRHWVTLKGWSRV